MSGREDITLRILSGPTGIGKTALAVEIAREWGGELISADSMQVYRELNIGTAKPTKDELKGVPYHLINLLSIRDKFDAGKFVALAREKLRDLADAGKPALIVGGTGLYLRALTEGLHEVPAMPAIRERLEAEGETHGWESLHRRLQQCDPVSAKKIHPNDGVRIVRALEVFEATGRPASELQQEWNAVNSHRNLRLVVLTCSRDELRRRIVQRTEAMLRAGWVEETRDLLAQGYSPQVHAFRSIGYSQLVGRLVRHEPLDGIQEEIVRATMQYAKRQWTWFRSLGGVRWVDITAPPKPELPKMLSNLLA
ncbi:MAG: tRNA (adenosine(37)-N6)-dimethylallyltransferase MiaA [bacterium]